ncbi:alpha/beta hydrolase [Amycolatopsis acidiphila]|uniref:Alpha/beta fold hydrolase n=1 Tax=Amycolatopsis acidiphila TaxID=715473 RepID=A0A558AA36_9PSEU|nr:alpha/beta fold hydrolase [Amycolatopsis acidiphila]TVT21120.1 alpha/beta fold hydrolase [Amycolatopsis acidiphila]UIJ57203.1 alpha/beta hydrolase [Amycolatopsis acidiphila]GHG52703.1 alpha/beta hydrolase [Amycolatopsis acidiphila]
MTVLSRARALVPAAAVLLSLPFTAVSAVSDPGGCSDVKVPASLAPGLPKDQTIYGRLCLPPGHAPDVLQILVHGASYDHTYWDFPGFGGQYSYTRTQNSAGYATLAIDQLGVGRSSHPLSALATQLAGASTVHDVVTAARGGALGPSFDRVALVGHSFGSLTVWLEAATYADVDGVLVSGASHSLGALALAELGPHIRPAQLDPVTAAHVPAADLGYVSIPGARAPIFYYLPNADPAVVAQDEATRSEIPVGVGATIPVYIPATVGIKVPVLEVNGVEDKPFCVQGGGGSLTDCRSDATLHDSEAVFFSPEAHLETTVIPDAGHDLNLQRNARVFFDRATRWFQNHFPLR